MSRYRGNIAAIKQLVRPTEVHRDVYIDEEVFQLEMEHLFANTWVYVGHDSQIPEPGDYFGTTIGLQPVLIRSLRRDPSWRDVPALLTLIRALARERPDIVHTHAAKAGTLGRVASILTSPAMPRRRPIRVHTYHGHSLTGYFSGRTASLYTQIERWLATVSDGQPSSASRQQQHDCSAVS